MDSLNSLIASPSFGIGIVFLMLEAKGLKHKSNCCTCNLPNESSVVPLKVISIYIKRT